MDWIQFTRARIIRHQSWKPCVCIQGGGAKGAWEAGVLAQLLRANAKLDPVAIWGTSAGALNALWASTLQEGSDPNGLLHCWRRLAHWVRGIVIAVLGLFYGCVVGTITIYGSPGLWKAALAAIVAAGLASTATWISSSLWLVRGLIFAIVALLLGVLLVAVLFIGWWSTLVALVAVVVALAFVVLTTFGAILVMPIQRLPGLIPVPWIARMLPRPEGPARCQTYFCTANVEAGAVPVSWDWKDLGIFQLDKSSHKAFLRRDSTGREFDSCTAAMSSAALPVLCRPFAVGEKKYLDGGMEANLPAGFIIEQGMLGGYCAICIVPRPIKLLSSRNHIDYRVLRFLRELKDAQALDRMEVAAAPTTGGWSAFSHTLCPVLVVSPVDELQSKLLAGFLSPRLLEREFEEGAKRGQQLLCAMESFEGGQDRALHSFLLDNLDLRHVTDEVPRPGLWVLWANIRWWR